MTGAMHHIVEIAISSRLLQLIILPTEHCNFRCLYCYEDFSIGKMTPEVVSGIKRLITRRADDLDRLQISWFGGEPLLALDIVKDICSHSKRVADGKIKKYSSDMTTNGYRLTRPVVEDLYELGVTSYQVSIDGPRDIHDKTRLRADKAGTFDQIWQNLTEIKQSSLPVNVLLRLHYMPDTVHRTGELVDSVREQFLENDSRFTVMFKAVERLGGPNDAAFNTFSKADKVRIGTELAERLHGWGRRANTVANTVLKGDMHEVCYASRANSFVVRANGKVGKCTVALQDERNAIGELTSDGRLLIDPVKMGPWIRGLETLDMNTLYCPLNGLPQSATRASELVQA